MTGNRCKTHKLDLNHLIKDSSKESKFLCPIKFYSDVCSAENMQTLCFHS